TLQQLEQQWVTFQFDVAGLRGAIGPLYQVTANARRSHTFYPGQAPDPRVVRAVMGPTPGERNGVPDASLITSGGTYVARILSVVAAGVILIFLDTAIQDFARRIGQPTGKDMQSGDDIPTTTGRLPEKASTIIWAAANSVRHVDEWFATADAYRNALSRDDVRLRDRQNSSMQPLAAVLGCALPITENVAFEVFQVLTEVDETSGTFDRLERHVLRVGQELIQRAGLANAPIGVTITEICSLDAIATEPSQNVMMSDGVARAASSLPDTGRLGSVRPLKGPHDDAPSA
ncbi:MAG TPA: hypothetical protein VGU66_10255, partial [Candidatus Elarobacter sp.]|nr:hypothetical protein [Candidatus Elarobacter sp.]